MKTLLFIYNPHSGKQRIATKLHDVVYHFATAGYEVTVHPTRFRGDATQVAAQRGNRYDMVVCCGGDGTLNEVVTGLLEHPEDMPTLGYIPAGTTNDFAKTLKIPASLTKGAEIAVAGTPVMCDVGDFNGNTFIYVAAFGAFTEVSYATPQIQKNMLGRMAYVLEGVKSLSQLRPYRMSVTFNGQTVEDEFIYGMVSDSVSVGGFRGVKESAVKLDDGLFEVLLVKKPRTLEDASAIITALLKKEPHEMVLGFQTGDVEFCCDERVSWTLDGEFGGDTHRARITNRTKAIKIMRG